MMDRQTVLTAGVVALMTGVGVIFAAVSARLYKEPVEPVMCTPATVVQEQPAPARQQGGMPQDVQELNLSDVQKTKIRVIVQRFRPQVTSAREKQRSQYEQRVEKILRKPTFDEEEARSTIAKYWQENAGKKTGIRRTRIAVDAPKTRDFPSADTGAAGTISAPAFGTRGL